MYLEERLYYIYILASQKKGTLYIGMTNNLARRVQEHKQGLLDGFSKRYNIKQLVYFEGTKYILNAIIREKRLKKWKREWKIKLIEEQNPEWKDLSNEIMI